MLEKATFKIKDKEIVCLKPYACDIMDIEDQSYDDSGNFDSIKYSELMLGLVTDLYKVKDLVKFNNEGIELSSGEKIYPKEIEYKDFITLLKKVNKRTDACRAMLRICGVEGEINLNSFTYKDLIALNDGLENLFDEKELNEVMVQIGKFCMSQEGKEE